MHFGCKLDSIIAHVGCKVALTRMEYRSLKILGILSQEMINIRDTFRFYIERF